MNNTDRVKIADNQWQHADGSIRDDKGWLLPDQDTGEDNAPRKQWNPANFSKVRVPYRSDDVCRVCSKPKQANRHTCGSERCNEIFSQQIANQ
jgi:hypothetical protein